MQNIGIIAEFNPFHSGHKYIIDEIKDENTAITVVMSGNFVQRGDTAIVSKSERAKAALKNGADLIIELPTPWSMATANDFAFGGVSILKNLGNIDGICFGSECGDIEHLKQTAELLISDEFNTKLNNNLNGGDTFAKLRSNTARLWGEQFEKVLQNPNDTLATEYIIAAKRLAFDCEFSCVKRVGAPHDSVCLAEHLSASMIRQQIKNGNFDVVRKYIPDFDSNSNVSSIENIENAILCDLRRKTVTNSLRNIADVSEGIENRLKNAILKATSLDELYSLIKTKRYTLARIRRLVLSAYLGIDSTYHAKEPPYIRVLGFTKKGEEILRDANKKANVPIITTASNLDKLDEFGKRVWQNECIATDIFSLSLTVPQACGNEYYHKIIKE